MDELLERGKQRGYLTFAEVNACLPEDLADPGKLDELLRLFEEHGIELVDEKDVEERERAPAGSASDDSPRDPEVSRWSLAPELEQTLRRAGVEVGGLICRREASGAVFDARLCVPGDRALAAWRVIRGLSPSLGHWPVIRGACLDAALKMPFLDDLCAGEGGGGDEEIRRQRERARALIEEAGRLAPDPRTFNRWHGGVCENLSAEEWERLCRGPAEPDALVRPDLLVPPEGLGDLFGEGTPFRGHLDERSYEPFPQVEIYLAPTAVAWEVFAYRPYGGWNGAPYPAEQLTMVRHWHERHGAEVVSVPGDWFEMYVPHPPRARADALRLVRELTGFGEETILGYGQLDIEEMIERVRRSHYWYFWWD